MQWFTRWFLDNPVAANLLMVFVLVAGYLSFQGIRVESFPQVPPSELTISVAYPGATPQQMDNTITQRIEEAISGVPGIKKVSSMSSAGFAEVTVRKKTGQDLDKLLDNIRNQVKSIVGFPEQAHRPKIMRNEFGNLASFVMIYGSDDENLLQQAAINVEKRLKRHPEISQVTNLGKLGQELVIEPNPEQLKHYGLTIETLASQLTQWSLDYRRGELDTAQGSITLRGDGYANNVLALQQLPMVQQADSQVTLGQLANVYRGYEHSDDIVRFQGEKAIALLISTSQKDDLMAVSKAVASVLEDTQTELPAAIKLDVMADMSPYIQEQLSLLGTNAWQGLLIVILLLGLFLNVKLAFWVALGIPVSVAGAFFLMGMPNLNYSINDITLFGMILVLGILVDDAVVVGESIHESREKLLRESARTGKVFNPLTAAYQGVERVAVPTTFGVLTTIAAFSPMLWIENELAQVLAGFSAVVIFALIFSLIESKFILPSHLAGVAHATHPKQKPATAINRVLAKANTALLVAREACLHALQRFTDRVYLPVLNAALDHKKTAFMLFTVAMLCAYGAMQKGHIRSVFFPEIPGRYATLKLTMDRDAPVELLQQHLPHLENSAKQLNQQLQQTFALEEAPIQQQLISLDDDGSIEMTLALSKTALANVPSQHLLDEWRSVIGKLEGSYSSKYTFADEPAGGTAITIRADNRDIAKRAAKQVITALAQQPGVKDVFDDSQVGSRQLKVTLNPRGVQLGISQRQLAMAVGDGFGEIEIHRLLEGGEELRVLMRYAKDQKANLAQLRLTPIHLGDNNYVTLGEVSDLTFSREPDVLYRHNRDEVISVYWQQNRQIAAPEAVWADVLQQDVPNIEAQYPGVKIEAIGEFSEIDEVQKGFKKAMLLTLLLIYILLAIPLKSYWQPMIIMAVIPFGFAGAVYGHGLMGLPVSLLSMFGMMAMTGVVINDALVLMNEFNLRYRGGTPLRQALLEAGRTRMRAIFLTTVTTVCGLLPLLFEQSEQAQYLKPAAVSLVFGELFATPITLVLIPILLGFSAKKG